MNPLPTLNLQTIPHPCHPDRAVQVHPSVEAAWEHVRKHVLSHPECRAWLLIDPELGELVDFQNPDARWNLARLESLSSEEVAQRCYDRYSHLLALVSRQSTQQGWCCEDPSRKVAVAFSPLGVVMVIQGHLKTAMVPGQGDAETTSASHEQQSKALPRERSAARPFGARARHPKEARKHRTRQEQWTREEWLYYEVFRPALQFLRSQNRNRDPYGRPTKHNDLHRLNEVLPPRKRLDYETWLTLISGTP